MKYLQKITMLLCGLLSFAVADASTRYAGGDISLLPEYEDAGAKYRDHAGKAIPDLIPYLHEEGMNAMRVRLFVDPFAHKTGHPQAYDPNACQDLDYIIPICRRIVDNGMALMLDFHYSDTWADPAKQWTPSAWENLDDSQLADRIYQYTREVLEQLDREGITPAFIQTGNEISFGMLWGAEGAPESDLKKTFMGNAANWDRLGMLLGRAIEACRQVCPEAQIVIHTERTGQPDVLLDLYDHMRDLKVDYDIIGLSYYPYFHGGMDKLDTSLECLGNEFPDKKVMIVETGYSYKWEVPGTEFDHTSRWPYSDAGQNAFARDLVATLEKHSNVNGLFWWWLEYNAYGTSLSGWYNAALFDSNTGRATSALRTICSFAEDTDSGVADAGEDAECSLPAVFDLSGRRVGSPAAGGIYVTEGRKTIVR